MKSLVLALAMSFAAASVQAGSGISAPDTLDSMAPVIQFLYPAGGETFNAADQETLRFTIDEPSWGSAPTPITLSFHVTGSPLTQVKLMPEPDGSYLHVWSVPTPAVSEGVQARFRVLATDRFGWLGLRYSGWVTIVDGVSSVPVAGLADRLGPVHPNPFNPRTTVSFSLASPAEIRLSVYDLRGRRIAILDQGPRSAGDHEAVWVGTTDGGSPAPSGVYFAQLEIRNDQGTRTHTARLALVK